MAPMAWVAISADTQSGRLSPMMPITSPLPKPEFDHAERKIMHARLVVVPGEDAPQSKILFAQRDLAAMFLGVEAQQFWIGVGLGDAAGVIHHAAVSAGAGTSSGSTSTSSSSPR